LTERLVDAVLPGWQINLTEWPTIWLISQPIDC
jgi:hypothetical protein